jgi:hypothetical protein
MKLTDSQIEQIKRFFTAVTALSTNSEIRLNPNQAKIALEVFMDPIKTPAKELPAVDLLDTQVAFFKLLSAHSARKKGAKKFFMILLLTSFVIGCYVAYQSGIESSLFTLVGCLIISFIINFVVAKFYVWKDFSPLKYGLTHVEVQFALDAIIADPKWPQNIEN